MTLQSFCDVEGELVVPALDTLKTQLLNLDDMRQLSAVPIDIDSTTDAVLSLMRRVCMIIRWPQPRSCHALLCCTSLPDLTGFAITKPNKHGNRL